MEEGHRQISEEPIAHETASEHPGLPNVEGTLAARVSNVLGAPQMVTKLLKLTFTRPKVS